jgi:hypothetical protein
MHACRMTLHRPATSSPVATVQSRGSRVRTYAQARREVIIFSHKLHTRNRHGKIKEGHQSYLALPRLGLIKEEQTQSQSNPCFSKISHKFIELFLLDS